MDTPSPARTIVYARQSRDHTGDMVAAGRQLDLCNALISQRNLGETREPIVDNDVSATNGKVRVGYQELLRLIRSDQVDTVVAYHLDRLLRGNTEMEQLITLCEKNNVRIITVAGDLDLSSDAGRLVGRILASVARGEVERKSARQKAAAIQAASDGKPPSRGAFGHARWIRDGDDRYQPPAEQIAAEAEAARKAYEGLFAGKGLDLLAKEFDEAGHLTTRGGKWTRSEMRAFLLNPRNAGLRYYRGEFAAAGNWPAIVSEETWQATVQMLNDPARRTNMGTGRRWIGGGLYLCGMCNESDMMTGVQEGGVRVYRCRKGRNNRRDGEKVDAYVLLTVAEYLRKVDVVRLLDGPNPEPLKVALRTEAAGLRKRLDGLGVDYAEGVLTGGQMRVATARLEARLAEVAAQLAKLGRRHELADLLDAPDPGAEFLNASLDVQRSAINAACVVTILPNPRKRWGSIKDTVVIDFREPV